MAPRTILYTGKGGVGKTSVAAATARRCAEAGLRTVVLSTDPAHSLSDSLEAELGGDPTPVGPNLFGQEVQAQEEMERHWDAVQEWLGDLFAERGVDRISAEELTVPPGMDELFSLLQIKRHHETSDFDAIVVDCAPTGETLRLLSFPDVASWWLEKVFSWERRVMSAARPIARGLFDVPLPSDAVFDDVERLTRNLVAMNGILRDRSAHLDPARHEPRPDGGEGGDAHLHVPQSLRLPHRRGDREPGLPGRRGRRLLRRLARSAGRAARARALRLLPIPILTAPYFPREVIGPEMLDRLGDELFGAADAGELLYRELSQELSGENGRATLRLQLPFAERGDIQLKKIGLEVVVRVDGQKRTIILPPTMAAYATSGARFEEGALEVYFEKDAHGHAKDDTT